VVILSELPTHYRHHFFTAVGLLFRHLMTMVTVNLFILYISTSFTHMYFLSCCLFFVIAGHV